MKPGATKQALVMTQVKEVRGFRFRHLISRHLKKPFSLDI